MARVPYQPFSTAEPLVSGERVAVNTPGAVFGENIGAALRQVGTSTEQAGNELFTRAIALQDLRNETDAREAQTEFATQSSELHAKFNALEGKAAVDGLKPYLAAQASLRQQIRQTLGSPMAQRYFDTDSLPFMQRNIFSAAGHSADENKKWVVGTAAANIDLQGKTFVNPTDDNEFQHKLDRIDTSADTIAAAHDWEPGGPQDTDYKFEQKSKLWMSRIVAIAHTDPQKALEILDQNKESLAQPDYDKALEIARVQNRSIGSALLANEIYSPDKTFDQMQKEIEARAPTLAQGDPLFLKDAITALRGKVNNDRYNTNLDVQRNKQTVIEGILGGVTDLRELRANPQIAAAMDALPGAMQKDVPGWINSYNANRDKVVHEQSFTTLWGLSNNDVGKFLDTNLGEYLDKHLISNAQFNRLVSKRAELIKNPQDDPRVLQALHWMQGAHAQELQALGIYHRASDSPDEYDHYTGALEGAIEAWITVKGHRPSYKEIVDEIGPQVIRQTTQPGAIFGNLWPNQTPFFDILQTHVSAAQDEARKRGIEPPTENEVRSAYIQQMFTKLFGGDSGGQRPAAP